jgi:acetyl esterase/lipase
MAGVVLATQLPAAKPDPLSRVTPVPANEPIPAIDFFRPPVFRSPILNGAGTHFLAIVSTGADRTDGLVYDVATREMERFTGGGNHDIAAAGWLDDKRFLFMMTKDKLYAYGLYSAELGKLSRAMVLDPFSVNEVVGVPRSNPSQPIIWVRHDARKEGGDGGVMRIDATVDPMRFGRHEPSVVHRYPSLTGGVPLAYLADGEGNLAYGAASKDGVTTLYRFTDEKWVPCKFDFDQLQLVGVGDRAGEVLVLRSKEAGKPRALYRYDTVAGELGQLVYQDDKYDLAGLGVARARDGRMIGLSYQGKLPAMVWFDPHYQAVQARLDASLPNLIVRILSADRSENRFLVTAFSDVSPPEYYVMDVSAATLTQITPATPWIDPARMQRMRGIAFKTRDGYELEGYVTLPAGASKEKPAPLVVLPHGGPWVRDTWGWNPEVQFLASRGYAVFQPNYRASPGYAWKFPLSDEWAFRKMHDDVTDGVKTVLKTGLIDRGRIAIMGGSFGGYLALCGVAFEPDMYRCAVTIAGVFDWERVMKEARGNVYGPANYGVLRKMLGDPKANAERFDEMSPLRHVSKVKVPLYVAHGLEDQIASVAQSKRLISELKKHKVPFEKQIEWTEGHGFSKLKNRVELYTAIEAFLAKHLAPTNR